MSYQVKYRGIEKQSNLYAVVQLISTGYFWDNTAQDWVSAVNANCKFSLSEGDAGFYSVTVSNLTLAKGGLYKIFIYDSGDVEIATTTLMGDPNLKTALQIVNAIQEKLRFPQSSDFSDAHAQLILSHVNTVIQKFRESGVWVSARISGSFQITDATDIWRISPVNTDFVDYIYELKITTNLPLVKRDEIDFQEIKRTETTGQPIFYRIFKRTGGDLLVQFSPTPDQIYTMSYEVGRQLRELSVVSDTPDIDSNLLIEGGTAYAKNEQGDMSRVDLNSYIDSLLNKVASEDNINTIDEVIV
jgi:hypothetical protein